MASQGTTTTTTTSGPMDTEAGGEQTQYEGTSTFMTPHAKSRGSFGGNSTGTKDVARNGGRAANGGDSGEEIAERGYSGQTAGNQGGGATKGPGYGKVDDSGEGKTEAGEKTRSEQGYGPGNDVGA